MIGDKSKVITLTKKKEEFVISRDNVKEWIIGQSNIINDVFFLIKKCHSSWWFKALSFDTNQSYTLL